MNPRPPVFPVKTSIEIAAPSEVVWKHVVTFSALAEPEEWYFRAGLAYPKRARIQGAGPGAVRYCEFSTGPFVEPIEVWDEPRPYTVKYTPPMTTPQDAAVSAFVLHHPDCAYFTVDEGDA